MDQNFDLVIIGAGPAGMAGALEAAKHKLSVLVLDEQPEAGGQIFRSISTTERLRPKIFSLLGKDYQSGKNLLSSFQRSGVKYLRNAQVSGKPRMPYCWMGVCYECLLEIDGEQNQQSCLIPVKDGMHVRRQSPAIKEL